MNAGLALHGLMTAIDEKRWDDLASYLHPEFVCRLAHTGESFNRDDWIRFNRDYPGFEHLTIEDFVAAETEAACRSHVTGHGEAGPQHFECASFARMRDGFIVGLTEIWTDVEQQAPPGTRPTPSSADPATPPAT
ncbi:nuclear transport factor 2 family protein [Microbacterium sp. NPDC056234]|uniref:nuclear transport factor 2 family protein n=1 Tax=Microbacterium sp. NPDC056234 TaxID=3345757 RepID=UPI0035E1C39D